LEPRFQGEGVVLGEYFVVSTKLDTFCYLTVQTAPGSGSGSRSIIDKTSVGVSRRWVRTAVYGIVLYVPSFWHNTGVWQIDGRTDGIAVASTALAMQALRSVVKRSSTRWLYCVEWP